MEENNEEKRDVDTRDVENVANSNNEEDRERARTDSQVDSVADSSGVDIAINSSKDDDDKKKKKEKEPRVPLRKMFTFATPMDRFLIVLGIIGAAARGAIMPLFSLLFGELIDAFNLPPDEIYDKMFSVALNFVWFGLGTLVCASFQHACFAITSNRQAQRLREEFINSLLKQEISYYDFNSTGSLVSHMSSDTVLFQEALGDKLGSCVQFLSTFLSGFAMGFYYGWKLTLVVAATTPLVAAAGAFMMILMTSFTTKGQKAYAKAGAVASEVFSGVRTVASFCAESIVTKKYSDNLIEATRLGIKRGFVAGLGMGLTFFIFYGVYALALWYGGKLVAEEGYSGGDVLTVFFSVIFGAFALGQSSQGLEALSKGQGAAYKLFNIIDRKPVIDSSSYNGERPDKVRGTIRLENVSFRYPSRPDSHIFDNLSIKIKSGQTVALVGPSGCGKSSIISLIQRFYDPESGSISIDKRDIKTLNVKWLRQQIGLVSQEPVLFSGTIAENIRYGKDDATQDEIEEAARSANAHDFISQFPDGYNTFVGEKGAQLSGGQKQRIAIARAIIKNPKILLLDEATSALDTESEKIVQDALDKVMKGRTTVVIAHRLSTIRDADNIIVINKGKLVEKGKHDDLMSKNGLYADLVRLQGGVGGSTSNKNGDDDDEIVLKKRKSKKQLEKEKEKEKKEEEEKLKENSSINKKKEEEEEEADKVHNVRFTRLLSLNRPEIPFLLLGTIAAMMNGAVNPVFSIVFSELINAYYKPADEIEDAIIPWTIAFIGIGVGTFIAQIGQAGLFELAGEKLVRRIREISFKSIIRKDIGWFDDENNNSGLISSRLASDATLISGLVGTRLGLTVANFTTIFAALLISFYYGWKLTLVLLATSPLVVFSHMMEFVAMKGMGGKNEEAAQKANQVASEAIQNIRTVASFTSEDRIYETYKRRLIAPTQLAVKKSTIRGFLVGVGECLLFISYFINFWYGGKLISDGEMTFLDVMKVFMAIVMSAMAIGQSSALAPNVPKGRLAAAHIFKLVDHKPIIDSGSDSGSKPSDVVGDIELHNVTFHYPTRPDVRVLDGINLKIESGKVTALVGASGCGKSSTVSLIERFYDVNNGKITLDGTDIRELNVRWLRQQIGLVSQEPVLFSGTIAENIRYGKEDATQDEIEEAAKAANAHNFVSQFPDKYNTFVGEKGAQLSGGQKQRIAIARAIIKNPKILLLDEATSALDTESEKIVQDALDKVMKGRTTVVIAHRLSTIRHADNICVIHKGRIVEQGNHDDLVKLEGIYYKLVTRQTRK